jgi:DNA-binding GntR family transcriptional regulator
MIERSAEAQTAPEAGNQTAKETVTLEKVHDLLRNRILQGQLPPGAVVSQAHLARDLGVSRSPIREACRLLEREGLLVSRHNYRVQVAEFRLDDLEELYASRLVLEPLALTMRVPSLTTRELDELATALEEMRQCAEQRDYGRFTVPHERFHALLAANNDGRLVRQIKQLADHAARYRRVYMTQTPSSWDVVIGHDTRILQAVSQGNAVAAGAEMARHLAGTALSMIALMDPLHDPRLLRAALHQACHPAEGNE